MESVTIISELFGVSPLMIALVIIWTLAWKGVALWRAAQLGQKKWFIAILLVNTLGLLEIVYLFISRKYKVEVVQEK